MFNCVFKIKIQIKFSEDIQVYLKMISIKNHTSPSIFSCSHYTCSNSVILSPLCASVPKGGSWPRFGSESTSTRIIWYRGRHCLWYSKRLESHNLSLVGSKKESPLPQVIKVYLTVLGEKQVTKLVQLL